MRDIHTLGIHEQEDAFLLMAQAITQSQGINYRSLPPAEKRRALIAAEGAFTALKNWLKLPVNS